MRRSANMTAARPGANMTPMIDVVFLLIIFFMLVAQITRQINIDLELARLDDSQAVMLEAGLRTTVHVIPEDRRAEFGGDFFLDGESFFDTEAGRRALADSVRTNLALAGDSRSVFLRAARDESYERVRSAMRAIAASGVDRVELVTAGRSGGAER